MSSIDEAYSMYLEHIYDIEKIQLLSRLGLKVAGSVPSVMWEAFGAVLTGRLGSGLTGADLLGWEVKSAKGRGSFEYQYHLNGGQHKLDEDCWVNHMFFSYSGVYENVIVRAMRGPELADCFFNNWRPGYADNYGGETKLQRFRRSIPYSYTQDNGILILEIRNGVIAFRDDSVIPQLNSEV
jgi:hypothetical protein